MAFLNDGTNHKDGISNELDLVEIINNRIEELAEWFPEIDEDSIFVECWHAGGTTRIADAVIDYIDGGLNHREIEISIKNKNKGIGVGSIDYLNSSAIIKKYKKDFYNKIFDIDEYHETLKKTLTVVEKIKVKESVREDVEYLANSILSELSFETLKSILENEVFHHKNLHIIVWDRKNNKLIHANYSDHPVVAALNNGYLPGIIDGKGRTSKKLVFTKGDNVIDFGIRVRLHLNNGVGAKLGLSAANSTSKWCFKVQQDRVNKLFEEHWNPEKVGIIGV